MPRGWNDIPQWVSSVKFVRIHCSKGLRSHGRRFAYFLELRKRKEVGVQ